MAILLLAFFITKPFLPAFITGVIIAYLSYPLYKKVLKHTKNKNVASFLIAVFIVLLVTIPSVIVLGVLSTEAYSTYRTLNQQNLGSNFIKIMCKDEKAFSCRAINSLVSFLPNQNLDYYIQLTIEKITNFIISNVSNFVASIPSMLINFLVMIFVVYYSLKDGEKMADRLRKILPMKELHKQHVFEKFRNVTYGVFYGSLSVAVVQGILAGVGFIIFGVQSPILWGFITILFALIPYVGTGVIWLPAALNLIFIGYLQSDNSSIVRGIGLIIYGTLIISSIDNILKPKLIGDKARVHPILVLLGVLGGLNLFGFIGLILGPVMLAVLMTFIDIYEEEKAELENYF
ncbi:AI-2E family transporter [Candidatus Woesearchaeota archaeon]|nr:AI-2E family transporter [Candidatus Woesearchaeota archaeon]